MNYLSVLEKVNYFMNKSGIRDYCKKECFGHCCGSSNEFAKKCNSEIRCKDKLSCSIFICQELRDIILPILGPKYDKIASIREKINSKIEKVLKDITSTSEHSSYFYSYSLSDVEHIQVPNFIDFSEEEIKMIRTKLANLRKGKKTFVCVSISYISGGQDIVEKAVLVRAISSRLASYKVYKQKKLPYASRTMTLKEARSWKESLNKII